MRTPTAWTTASLEDLVTFRTGKLDSNAAVPEGKYPFFTCSQQTLRTDTFSFDEECVILAGNNANGIYPLKYFSGKFDAYQRTYVIRSIDPSRLDNAHLYYALRLQLEHLRSISTGAATKFLTLDMLRRTVIPLPPLPTQRRIASILSAYDDLIENNSRRIKILEEMAQALYREWFVHFRFPGHQHVKMVDSELGPIPEGWEIRALGDLVENFDARRKPLSSLQRTKRKGPYPYYGAAKVFDHIDSYIFDGKFLLFAEDGSVITPDRRPVLQLVDEKFWANNHTHVLRGRGVCTTDFLYLCLLDLDLSGYITGAAQPKVTQANLNRIPIRIATPALLSTFQGLVGPLVNLMHRLAKANAILVATRDLLLPKLISGELSTQGLDAKAEEDIACVSMA